MAKKKPEKEPKEAKAKKTKEKPPKTNKKKKGKSKDAEETAVETAAASETAEAAENEEADGKEEKKKKSGRGILEPVLCVLIAILAVFEIGLVCIWLTNPTAEEIRAQLEAQTPPHAAWSASSYANRHGTYRPSDIPAPVATHATSDDIPATAQPAAQQQADATAVPTV